MKLVDYWKDHPVGSDRFSNLKLSMFVKSDDAHDSFPKLSGRAIEIKNLMPALAHVWAELSDAASVPHQAVLWGLVQSARMDSILDLYPDADRLPAADANAYRDAAYGYARTQEHLQISIMRRVAVPLCFLISPPKLIGCCMELTTPYTLTLGFPGTMLGKISWAR